VGRETEGVVTLMPRGDKSIVRFGVSPFVYYRFTAGGRAYDGRARLALRHWNGLQAGGPIAVRYLPSDPANNFPSADPPEPTVPLLYAYSVCSLCAGFGVVGLFGLWRGRGYLAHGQVVPALVKGVSVKRSRGTAYLTVHYEFPLPGGFMCRGKYDDVNAVPPPEGSLICVLHDPDKPRRHAIYPLSLLKVRAE
jgi:hypothetical protein